MEIRVGDLVGRKSYGYDIIFKVQNIYVQNDGSRMVYLAGLNYRLSADAPEQDLVKMPPAKIQDENKEFQHKVDRLTAQRNRHPSMRTGASKMLFFARDQYATFKRPGKVLHLDGDNDYLQMCLKQYKELGIQAVGKLVAEDQQPKLVKLLLEEHKPDIVVLTGHDSMAKEGNKPADARNTNALGRYKNSKFYIEAVKEARRYQPALDELVVVAGACQSFYEGILAAGANFASSPGRIMIHALDPVMVCKQIAFTPIDRIAPLEAVLRNTITGINGIGGVQTRGRYRDGMPDSPYIV